AAVLWPEVSPHALGLLMPTYTFATPVFGGQLTVGAIGIYGRTDTSLAGSVTGALATPLGTLPFSRFDTISDSVDGFGDVLYRVPEIVTRGRFPDGGESDSTWRTQEARHVGSDTIAPGF